MDKKGVRNAEKNVVGLGVLSTPVAIDAIVAVFTS